MKHLATAALVLAGLGTHATTATAQPATQDSTAAMGSLTVPLPVLFYTPETKLGGGVVLLHSRRATGALEQRPSAFAAQALYTAEGQTMLSTSLEIYTPANRHHFSGGVSYSRYPTAFWGIGDRTPAEAEERYTSRATEVEVELRRQIQPGLYIGASATTSRVQILQVAEGGLLDGTEVVGRTGGWGWGGGVSVAHDTRDNVNAPHSGTFARATANRFGGEYSFSRYRVDLRHYFEFGPGVLAAQGVATVTDGRVPFYRLPSIGGQNEMRGYQEGRYRDQHALSTQVEYRAPVWRRLGAAAFLSTGAVAPKLGDFGSSDVKLAGGWGIRYLLSRSEGLNVRVDFGYGKGSSGTYITLGEAF